MSMAQKDKLKLVLRQDELFVYTLFLDGKKKSRYIKAKMFEGEIRDFKTPVTNNKTPKLCIVRKTTGKKQILYVGYADQGIAARMWYGLNPKHQKNYHGYGWSDEKEVELLVWVFQPFRDKTKKVNKDYNELLKKSVECIEAEIVFYLRNKNHEWPKSQAEIHFGNENREEVSRITKEIISVLTKK